MTDANAGALPPPAPARTAEETASDQYRALFEQSADAILIIDGETFVDCNQATVDMLRYETREELLRTHPSELSPPVQPDGRESFEKANEMITQAFEKGSHRFEWDHRRADGEVFPVEVLLTVVPQGERMILHCVWRDITERKELEHQLRQSQKMEAIGQLAGGIAHDFNNLLVAILGNAELLEGELDGQEDLQEFAEQIHEAADRAAALTRQLLAFSRKQILQPKVFDLNAAVEDLRAFLSRLIGENLRLVTRLHGNEVKVKVDPGKLDQVVVNLVTNARDAMPEGGEILIETVELTIGKEGDEVTLDLPPGRYARLTVRDTGTGMSEETVKKAFDPFFTTKDVGAGTGLGLSTAYGIVKQSRGDMSLRSEVGRGTEIQVFLPVVEEQIDRAVSRREEGDVPVGDGETILVVEDEPAVSTLVARVLSQHGYRILMAENGREALERYREHDGEVDLLLTDVVMPELGGPELVEALHAAGAEPRVIFASGYLDGARARLESLDPDAVILKKPFSPGTLLRRVREMLDRGVPRQSLSSPGAARGEESD